MKYKVNSEACIGCGSCVSICPEVFEFNDEGYAVAKEVVLTPEINEQADDAMNSCPTNAISKEEEKIQ